MHKASFLLPHKNLLYLYIFLQTVLFTVLLYPVKDFLGLGNLALIYLLPVLFFSAIWGTGPGLVSALSNVLAWDFFYVPPKFSISVHDFRYLISFSIFVLVGFITGSLSNKLKELTKEVQQANNLAESERLRTALFNSLSHDLRTPLASIIGAVTGLLEGENIYSPEARQALLLSIQQGATRMHRFINNLLDMARLESGMLKLKKEWCDVQDIIGVVIGQLEETLRGRYLKVNIAEDLPIIKGDFVLIEQVFINILDNALKYSQPGSEISVSVGKTGEFIKVSIADIGPTIPAQDIAKIFDKFYRLTSPLQVSGTGLGLAICKGIIEAHGGDIWAENNSPSGVIISFKLPLSEDGGSSMLLVKEGDFDGE